MWAHCVLMSLSKTLVCMFPVRSIILLPLFSLSALVGLGRAVQRHNGSLNEQRDHLSKTCWGAMHGHHKHNHGQMWKLCCATRRAHNSKYIADLSDPSQHTRTFHLIKIVPHSNGGTAAQCTMLHTVLITWSIFRLLWIANEGDKIRNLHQSQCEACMRGICFSFLEIEIEILWCLRNKNLNSTVF